MKLWKTLSRLFTNRSNAKPVDLQTLREEAVAHFCTMHENRNLDISLSNMDLEAAITDGIITHNTEGGG